MSSECGWGNSPSYFEEEEEEMVKKTTKNKYYDSKGKLLPGVTTVLGVIAKPALIEWAFKLGLEGTDYKKVRDGRALIGTMVHNCIESILREEELPDLSHLSLEDTQIVLKAIENFNKWIKKYPDLEILEIEVSMSSDVYRYGGTFDIYAKYKGNYILIDLKTSKMVYEEHKTQQAGYKILMEELNKPVDEIWLLQVNENGSHLFKLLPRLIPLYTKLFLAALEIYKQQKAISIITSRTKAKTNKFKEVKEINRTIY